MHIVRTILWVLLLVALLLFSIANWDPTVTVRIWESYVVDTKIPAIVVVSFLIGFVPMWLYHRASKWQMRRKINSLENAARTAVSTPVAAHPVADEEVREHPVVVRTTEAVPPTTERTEPTTSHPDDHPLDGPATYRSPGA